MAVTLIHNMWNTSEVLKQINSLGKLIINEITTILNLFYGVNCFLWSLYPKMNGWFYRMVGYAVADLKESTTYNFNYKCIC